VDSLLYQDTASLGGNPGEVLGTTVYLNNGAGIGNLIVAQQIQGFDVEALADVSVGADLNMGVNTYFGTSAVYDANDLVGSGEQVLVSQPDGSVEWQNYQGSGLEFQGSWDARTSAEGGALGDGGNPNLLNVPLDPANTGKYWIVTADGSVALTTQGGGTITDWKVGDWAIVSEDLNNNIFWDKIDNSSVLTGAGTAGNIAIWTSSNELGDAPIVIDPIPGGTSLAFNDTATHTITGTSSSNAFGSTQVITANYAISSGEDNTNSGQSSILVGANSTNAAQEAAVFGSSHSVDATAQASLVGGTDNIVSGTNALATGNGNTVSGENSAAFGESNEVSGLGSIVSGDTNIVSGDSSFAIGENLTVSGVGSVASGQGNTVAGDYSIAVGDNNLIDASSGLSIAVGQNHQIDTAQNAAFGDGINIGVGTGNIAAGKSHNITDALNAVFGDTHTVSSTRSLVAGNTNTVSGSGSVTGGDGNTNEATSSLVVGSSNSVTTPAKFVLVSGEDNEVTNTHATALGDGVKVSGISAIGVGTASVAEGNNSVAMGDTATAKKDGGISLGTKTESLDNYDVAIGDGAIAQGSNSVSIGKDTNATGLKSMALVDASVAGGESALAGGKAATASGDGSVALGNAATTSGLRSVALGDEAESQGEGSAALGYKALAVGKYATAIGPESNANGEGSISMGSGSSANGKYSIAIGSDNDVVEDGGLGNVAIGHNNKVNDIAAAQPGNGNFALGNSNTITGSVGAVGEGNEWLISAGSVGRKSLILGNDNQPSGGAVGRVGAIVLGNSLNNFVQDNAIYIGGTNRTSFYSNQKPGPSNLSQEIVRMVASAVRVGTGLVVADRVDQGSNTPAASMIVGPYSAQQSISSNSSGCAIIGIRNELIAGTGSAILGVDNSADFTNATDTSRSHIIGYQNTMQDCYSSFIVGGQNDITTENNAFALGFSNVLAGQDSMFSFGENNTGPNGVNDRNSFTIGAQLQGSDKTMNLGFRNNVAEYPATDRSNGLGEVAFSVSTGLNVNTDSNALLITEGGINGGAPSAPQVPRVILPTVVGFNFADDTAAAAGGIPVGGLYHNAGVVRIRIA